MFYFKAVQKNNVVGVGGYYLKWYPRSRRIDYCDINKAMLAQDDITGKMYHCRWFYDVPEEAKAEYEEAEIIVIEKPEYDALYERLKDGEEVKEPEEAPPEEPYVEPEPEPVPEPERMTVQQMREKIQEQEATISLLTDCILELSGTVYGE